MQLMIIILIFQIKLLRRHPKSINGQPIDLTDHLFFDLLNRSPISMLLIDHLPQHQRVFMHQILHYPGNIVSILGIVGVRHYIFWYDAIFLNDRGSIGPLPAIIFRKCHIKIDQPIMKWQCGRSNDILQKHIGPFNTIPEKQIILR